MELIYPWLVEQWQQMQARMAQGRLPHGLLLHGPAGLGKRAFASQLAAGLLCTSPVAGGFPCGSCTGCTLRLAGTHPDFLNISPPEGKQQIVIDQVRELCASMGLMSHSGGYKVAIVDPAHAMNTAAANSLLKTLEEPTDNTVLMLITEHPARLPATIRSRCQALRFQAPPAAEVTDWLSQRAGDEDAGLLLDLAEGAPLRALELRESGVVSERRDWARALLEVRGGKTDPLSLAADWSKDDKLLPLHWLGSWLMDMIRLQSVPGAEIRNRDLASELERLAQGWTAAQLHQLLDEVWQAIRMSVTPVNRQLLLEGLLTRWSRGRI